jgi:hypothetical protein
MNYRITYRAPPNCQHLDNHRNCKIFHDQYAILKYFGIRPGCVLDQLPPRDGAWTCSEQKPWPRPKPPPPMRPK